MSCHRRQVERARHSFLSMKEPDKVPVGHNCRGSPAQIPLMHMNHVFETKRLPPQSPHLNAILDIHILKNQLTMAAPPSKILLAAAGINALLALGHTVRFVAHI